MKRLAFAVVTAVTLFGVVFGLAASLGVTANDMGAGSSTVSACDPNITVSFGLVTGSVTDIGAVTVGDIDPACSGQTVLVQLLDGTGAVLANETATIATLTAVGSQAVPLTTPVAAAAVTSTDVTIYQS